MPQITDTENCSKSRNDEDSINFRPSPNFKHMKKYLKSKFEEANQNAANDSTESATSPTMNGNNAQKQAPKEIQPPLPPHPPPDDPPNIKKEIEDKDYNVEILQKNVTESNNGDKELSDKPSKTMCRNFIRGTCHRGASCKFVHKLIPSQLSSVYTFCKDFQNSKCTYPKCKFLHATVFEKENFCRTGYLPPHIISQIKQGYSQQQQQQQPPLPKETPVAPPMFNKPPPPMFKKPPPPILPGPSASVPPSPAHAGGPPPPPLSSVTAPAPVVSVPTATINTRTDIFKRPAPPNASPLKREWSDAASNSKSSDFDSGEPLAKKCNNCDSNEFRLQYAKDKVKKLMQASEELRKKISIVNEKNSRLRSVFELWTTKSNAIGNDREKNLMEKLSHLLA